VQRLISSIKKWNVGNQTKRNQLIEAVDDDGNVDVSGIKVSLFDLFKTVAPLGKINCIHTPFELFNVNIFFKISFILYFFY
jgi:hypothetical protein